MFLQVDAERKWSSSITKTRHFVDTLLLQRNFNYLHHFARFSVEIKYELFQFLLLVRQGSIVRSRPSAPEPKKYFSSFYEFFLRLYFQKVDSAASDCFRGFTTEIALLIFDL